MRILFDDVLGQWNYVAPKNEQIEFAQAIQYEKIGVAQFISCSLLSEKSI
jgi:hypothetical protein